MSAPKVVIAIVVAAIVATVCYVAKSSAGTMGCSRAQAVERQVQQADRDMGARR